MTMKMRKSANNELDSVLARYVARNLSELEKFLRNRTKTRMKMMIMMKNLKPMTIPTT